MHPIYPSCLATENARCTSSRIPFHILLPKKNKKGKKTPEKKMRKMKQREGMRRNHGNLGRAVIGSAPAHPRPKIRRCEDRTRILILLLEEAGSILSLSFLSPSLLLSFPSRVRGDLSWGTSFGGHVGFFSFVRQRSIGGSRLE